MKFSQFSIVKDRWVIGVHQYYTLLHTLTCTRLNTNKKTVH